MLQSVLETMFRGADRAASRQSRSKTAGSVSAAGNAGKKANKKAKKKARQLCQNQVAQCQTSLTKLCEGEPTCLEGLVCCDAFAMCDTTGALACIATGAQR